MYSIPFSRLCRNWIADKLADRAPLQEQNHILNELLAMQPHCNINLYSRTLATFLARYAGFLKFFQKPKNQAPDFEFEHHYRATVSPLRVTVPSSKGPLFSKLRKIYFCFFLCLTYCIFLIFYFSILFFSSIREIGTFFRFFSLVGTSLVGSERIELVNELQGIK